MYLTAVDSAETAETHDSKMYLTGVRDAFEAMYRACHELPNDVCARSHAHQMLALMPVKERVHLLTQAQDAIYRRRSESFLSA